MHDRDPSYGNFPNRETVFSCVLGSGGEGDGDYSPIWARKVCVAPKGMGF